jgi:UDP-N-acetylmuramate dehydrogenase
MIKKELKNLNFKGNIYHDLNIRDKTAFKTDALCNYFIEPEDLDSLLNLIKYLNQKNEEFFILGGGNNTLIKPGGIKIIVSLKKFFNKFEIVKQTENKVYLKIQSGAMLQKICWYCAVKGYEGLNPLIGIPGTLGGALFMNAGTKYGDISPSVNEITIIDSKGNLLKASGADLIAGYREIKIKNIENFIIIDSTLKLEISDKTKVLKEAKQLLKLRKISQPVKEKSCGCFFKNPDKSPAGMLIEKAGLKGKKIGGAKVSTIHANFILSENGCKASDIIELKDLITAEIKNKFGIMLEPEVKIVGR